VRIPLSEVAAARDSVTSALSPVQPKARDHPRHRGGYFTHGIQSGGSRSAQRMTYWLQLTASLSLRQTMRMRQPQ
jgi:hypothetical protein